MLQSKNAQIKDLEANLARARNFIHFYEMENKQIGAQNVVYDDREIRAQKEAQRA